jgi:hypothetical protein
LSHPDDNSIKLEEVEWIGNLVETKRIKQIFRTGLDFEIDTYQYRNYFFEDKPVNW